LARRGVWRERGGGFPTGGALMGDKPSYLGLLNAIANAEGQAHEYLRAWIEVSPSADVRGVLGKIAAREGEHAMSFARRINELGYEVRPNEAGTNDKAMAVVKSECSDREKLEALKLHRLDTGDKPDIFDDFFKDHSIDIETGALLGRYIAEERDSGRMFRQCYELLCAAEGGDARTPADDRLASLERKLDALCGAVEELRDAMPAVASGSNGSKAKLRSK
jgi:rubrerythrin